VVRDRKPTKLLTDITNHINGIMQKSGLSFRRMYETRHTFASWALAVGESPEWLDRTLGHVDTSMILEPMADIFQT
jgi:hypothetical protein